jgi:hypothetical protein
MVVSGLMLRKREGFDGWSGEPLLTVLYLIWPFTLVLVLTYMTIHDWRKARAVTKDRELPEAKVMNPRKDLN